MDTIFIAGGGTGGHIMPALAVARQLVQDNDNLQVEFIGTAQGMEATLVPEAGFKLHELPVRPLKRVGLKNTIKALFALPKALLASLSLIKEARPMAVIGVGGYAAGPIVLAAWLKGIPTAIMEQNSFPGLTNRILSKLVREIYTGMPTQRFPVKKVRFLGNPVRKEIIAAREHQYEEPQNGFTLLVAGGSQGAHAINQLLADAAPKLKAISGLKIIHQAGKSDIELLQKVYSEAGITAEVFAFDTKMAERYSAAHLIIARAGAMTISEIAAIGRPAILIPFPYASDNHQLFNAKYLANYGAAIIMEQKVTTPALLAKKVLDLAAHPASLSDMAQKARELGKVEAARQIAAALIALSGRNIRGADKLVATGEASGEKADV